MIAAMSEAMNQGDPRAASDFLALVYQELRQLARAQMARERAGHTLQATALVHEAYMRLIESQQWAHVQGPRRLMPPARARGMLSPTP